MYSTFLAIQVELLAINLKRAADLINNKQDLYLFILVSNNIALGIKSNATMNSLLAFDITQSSFVLSVETIK